MPRRIGKCLQRSRTSSSTSPRGARVFASIVASACGLATVDVLPAADPVRIPDLAQRDLLVVAPVLRVLAAVREAAPLREVERVGDLARDYLEALALAREARNGLAQSQRVGMACVME